MYGSRCGHVLQTGDKYVPFDTYSENYTDEDGEVRAIVCFYSFGRSELGEMRRIPDIEFASKDEEERLQRGRGRCQRRIRNRPKGYDGHQRTHSHL